MRPWEEMGYRLRQYMAVPDPMAIAQHDFIRWWIKTNPYHQYEVARDILLDLSEDEFAALAARYILERAE